MLRYNVKSLPGKLVYIRIYEKDIHLTLLSKAGCWLPVDYLLLDIEPDKWVTSDAP
jgi:hypothetical protein